MPGKLPPLSTLRLFDAAGRHQSFKAAAAELHVTPGAVSHGIAVLERWLGVPLFVRGPRGLALSPAGRDYLPYVAEALALIATGTQRMPSCAGEGKLIVSAAPTFAKHLLIPILHRFRKQRPRITVSIDTQRRQVSFPVDGIDFAIRMAHGPSPGLRSTELLRERLVPVCSPSLRARLEADGTDLASATRIHIDGASEDWAAWLDALGRESPAAMAELHFDTIQMAVDAAVAGLGVAIGRRPLIDGDLAAGRLVVIGPEVAAATGYWLVSHPGAGERADLAGFERWLVAEMREFAGRLAA